MNEIVVKNVDSVEVMLQAEALVAKSEILKGSAEIRKVDSDASQQMAVYSMAAIKKLLKQMETSRKDVKEPVLALGKKIDNIAKEFAADLEKEAVRIAALVSAYEVEKRRITQEAEMKRQAEIQKLEDDRRKAEEAERRKAQAAENAKTDAARQKALAAQNEAKIKQLEAERDIKKKAEEIAESKPASRAEGSVTREVIRFEVEDIHRLYRVLPRLVKLEPITSEINRYLKENPTMEVPGLKVWKETVVGVRT